VEKWATAADTVEKDHQQYFQFYYEESTHTVEVLLRVDEGSVDLLISPDGLPEPGVSASYLAVPYSAMGISNYYVASIPFQQLSGRRSVYIAVNGVGKNSRFNVVAHKKDFDTTRSLLADNTEVVVTTPLKTQTMDLYEYGLSAAPNDVDVEVAVEVTTGAVTVFTSKDERFPSPLRALTMGTCVDGGTVDSTITDSASCTTPKVWNAATLPGYWRVSASTAAGSTASMIHTIKPDEPRRLYISVRGDAADVAPGSTDGSPQAAGLNHIGYTPGTTTYKIKAKIFRYKIKSQLLDLSAIPLAQTAISTSAVVVSGIATKTLTGATSFATAGFAQGDSVIISHKAGTTACAAIATTVTSKAFTVASVATTSLVLVESILANEVNSGECLISRPAVSSLMEEERYGDVSVENFNYYEVQCSKNAQSATVTITLNNGDVEMYHSTTKLPSRDTSIGHTTKAPSASYAWSQVATPKVLTVPIPFAQFNKMQHKIYIGVYGVEASAYTIKVTQTLLPGAASTGPTVLDFTTVYSEAQTATLTANEYYFMAIPVAPVDTSMSVHYRSGAGTRTQSWAGSDAAAQAAWGTDWTEPLKETWKQSHADENDLDVTLTLSMTTATSLTAYASSREVYTSAERGYDATGTLVSGGSSASLTVSHYTFGDQVVYMSLLSMTDQSVTFTLSKADQTRSVSSDTATTKRTCAALSSCSNHGSCISTISNSAIATPDFSKAATYIEKCYCHEGWTGADCSVAAFLGSDSTPNNPRVIISSSWPGAQSPFDEAANITLPYEVRNAPPYGKIRIRVDGKPWPDRVGSVVHMGSGGTGAGGNTNTFFDLLIVGLATGVDHTVQIYLTAPSGKLLDAAERQFQTKRSGGCAPDASGNACSGQGLCFNGYCVCYDGYIGTKCEITDSTAGTNLGGGVCSDPTKLTQGACVSPATWNTEVGAASYTDPGGVCSDAQYTTQAQCVSPATWAPFKPPPRTRRSRRWRPRTRRRRRRRRTRPQSGGRSVCPIARRHRECMRRRKGMVAHLVSVRARACGSCKSRR